MGIHNQNLEKEYQTRWQPRKNSIHLIHLPLRSEYHFQRYFEGRHPIYRSGRNKDFVALSKKLKGKSDMERTDFTAQDFEVKVIDFWPARIASTGQPALGGTPFKGKVRIGDSAKASAKGPGTASTLAIVGDGDADVVYKYSIVARMVLARGYS
jgi:hypothetical protein